MGEHIGPEGLTPIPIETRRRRRPPEDPDIRRLAAFLLGLLALAGLLYASRLFALPAYS